jgi:Ca-activated chloride channel family protein
MFFQDYGVRGFVAAAKDNLSTFAVDVDTGSYTVARSYVQDGYLPPADAIRPEEFINYFHYGYPNPSREETFGITVDGAPSPFLAAPEHRMVRVGIQGYAVPAEERPDANLTFVIDVSGSMAQENRLGLAKRALYLLVDELRLTDQVAIAVYGTDAREILPMTPAAEKQTILRAINRLNPEGSTNAAAGLELGYEIAAGSFDPEAINRVVLLSDGFANVGVVESDQILRLIKHEADAGITMTTVGLGMGNYNDTLMEQLADDGDGFYAYVDTLEQARRVFVDQLTSTLLTIAKDAKIQVEFNPEVVESYRLVGYENRKVKDEDFRNDDVDAGEIGAGHSVTALYEVALAEGAADADPAANVATVRLRWEEPATGEVIETSQPFTVGELTASFADAAPRFQLANAVAEYAEVLRQTDYGKDTWLGDLQAEVERIGAAIEEQEGAADPDVAELAQLMWLAESMMPVNPASLEE